MASKVDFGEVELARSEDNTLRTPTKDERSRDEDDFVDDPVRAAKLRHRIDRHLVPLCAFVYLLNYLDRSNIGNSKILNRETGDSFMQKLKLDDQKFAITVTLFSLAYFLFEIPANWIMKRYVRPTIWLPCLLGGWGMMTIGFAGVQTYTQVVVLRFFIGVFEAGFFPGMVFLITHYYAVDERSIRIAFIGSSTTVAGAFGGCIAYGVGMMNGKSGLEGFRWLFIIEGSITMFAMVLLFLFLPDYPKREKWLSQSDKQFLEDRIAIKGGRATTAKSTKNEILNTLFSPRMIAHYFAYCLNGIPIGSLTFFTPQIVNGLGFTSIQSQLMTVPPWIVGYIVCLSVAKSSDHFNMRGWHVTAASIVGGIGWLTAGCLPADAYHARYACLFLCACGAFPSANPMTNWVTCNVPSFSCMAFAIAANNSLIGISSIISQWIWKHSEADRGYPTGNFTCAACSFVVAAVAFGLRVTYGRMNARRVRDVNGRERTWLL